MQPEKKRYFSRYSEGTFTSYHTSPEIKTVKKQFTPIKWHKYAAEQDQKQKKKKQDLLK